MNESTIETQYRADESRRQDALDIAYRCVNQSKPTLLPPENQSKNTELPEKYHSLGSRGLTNLEGRLVTALFPADTPWFLQVPKAEIRYSNLPPEPVQEMEQALFLRSMSMVAKVEQQDPHQRNGTSQGFRTQKRKSLSQCVATGETLERLNDDYSLTVFRRDRYVNCIDGSGSVVYHITQEQIDPARALDDRQREECGIKPSDLEMSPHDRMLPLFTICEWQPNGRDWLIRQECKGKTVMEKSERVSPYFWTPFDLVGEESYGRGFFETHLADLETYNATCEILINAGYMNSKFHPIIDPSSNLKPHDLQQRTGAILTDYVVAGQPQKIGAWQALRPGDVTFIFELWKALGADLAKSMLLTADAVRDSERTTAYEVQAATINQLEGALGGFYAPIADRMQLPLIHRLEWQMERDRLLKPLGKGRRAVDYTTLTGIAALSRQRTFSTMQGFVKIVAEMMQPNVLPREIDRRVFIDVTARYAGLYIPGLVKSKEQVAAEIQQEMQMQAQAQAQQQAIQTAGAVVENAAAAGVQQRTQTNG